MKRSKRCQFIDLSQLEHGRTHRALLPGDLDVRKSQGRYKVAVWRSSVGSKGGAIDCLDRFRVTVNTPRPSGGRRDLPFREMRDRVAVRVFGWRPPTPNVTRGGHSI